jgi:phosphoglycerate kinase
MVRLIQRLADFVSLGGQEGVGHGAADHQCLDAVHQIFQKRDLGGDFRAAHRTVPISDIAADEMVLDVGPDSIAAFANRLSNTRTLVWNGPFGAFETPPFDAGTVAAAQKVASLTKAGQLLSVAGGGDTVAALAHAGVEGDFTYVSTAGGAFLEWLEGKTLPGVEALSSN